MRVLVAAMLVFVGGCSGGAEHAASYLVAGPSPHDQEAALRLVWEGVYGMTRDSLPTITWWKACPDGHGNEGCYDEYSTPGDVNVIWIGTNPTTGVDLAGRLISDTTYSTALEYEREWQVYPSGELAPQSEVDRLTRAAQVALRAAGL